MPIITVITLFVLGLLICVRDPLQQAGQPDAGAWSHNTPIEIIWTVVPVLILMVIAIFSFRLLFAYHDMPKPDLTVKATGYQWYWGYEYPDQKVAEFISQHAAGGRGQGRRACPTAWPPTEPLVVPVTRPSACWSPAPT